VRLTRRQAEQIKLQLPSATIPSRSAAASEGIQALKLFRAPLLVAARRVPPIAVLRCIDAGSSCPQTPVGMWVCEEEQVILRYLKQVGEAGASARELARKAGTKDQWKENERWASSFIQALKDKGLIETNKAGVFVLTAKAAAS
jgi:uncharacterized protein YwlG (UPF0340 family)